VCGSGSTGSSSGKKKKLALKASKASAVATVPEIEPSDEQLELEMHQALCRGMFRLVAAGTQFPCFTGTKIQILTPEELLQASVTGSTTSKASSSPPSRSASIDALGR
jgi:hypothetical protein